MHIPFTKFAPITDVHRDQEGTHLINKTVVSHSFFLLCVTQSLCIRVHISSQFLCHLHLDTARCYLYGFFFPALTLFVFATRISLSNIIFFKFRFSQFSCVLLAFRMVIVDEFILYPHSDDYWVCERSVKFHLLYVENSANENSHTKEI